MSRLNKLYEAMDTLRKEGLPVDDLSCPTQIVRNRICAHNGTDSVPILSL